MREGDRDQDITYASSAQLPEIVDREEFKWKPVPGLHLEYTNAEDVVLIVTNKGQEGDGFVVRESCGAAWLSGQEPRANRIGGPS